MQLHPPLRPVGRHASHDQRRRRAGRGAVLVVAGFVAGALLAGGVAVATIPSSTGGRITACVTSKGAVRIIDYQAGKRCVTGERLVDWQRLANRGTWSSTASYAAGDIVQSGGTTYLAKAASQGRAVTSTTYWTVLAARGAQGLRGPQGPQGPQGPEGPVGPSRAIVASLVPYYGDPMPLQGDPFLVTTLPAGSYHVSVALSFSAGPVEGTGQVSCTSDYSIAGQPYAGFIAASQITAGGFASLTGEDVLTVAAESSVSIRCYWSSGVALLNSTLTATEVGSVVGTSNVRPVL